MKFVATETAEQLDLQALHRVRERLVSQRTGIINQIRAFMLERGIALSARRMDEEGTSTPIALAACRLCAAQQLDELRDQHLATELNDARAALP
jgi:transposase